METKNIYFISGIDTDAGKSYCTAWYARELMQRGLRVITQKFIQTGNTGHSEVIGQRARYLFRLLILGLVQRVEVSWQN